jgi:hypothetical protein
MMPDFTAAVARNPALEQARGDVANVSRALRRFLLSVAVGAVVLLGWLIARLVSPAVRDEFAPPGGAGAHFPS